MAYVREHTLQVPSMPYFGREKFLAPGPASAHALSVLWQSMLGRLLPERVGIAERKGHFTPRARTTSFRAVQQPGYDTVCQYFHFSLQRYPDEMWLRLFSETGLQLHPGVHAALWAPYLVEGRLPEKNLAEVILQRVQPVFLETNWGTSKVMYFLSILEARADRYGLPNLELRCAPPCWEDYDRDANVHGAEGPARVWQDGTTVYCWRGTMCPEAWLPRPTLSWVEARPHLPTLIPRFADYKAPSPREALQTSNVELRRVAVEIVGWDAIISGLRGIVVDEDPDPQIGTLVRVRIPPPPEWWNAASEELYFLRVQCGTGRRFALAVPPTMKTARQANAWTYGLDPDEYAPEVRT